MMSRRPRLDSRAITRRQYLAGILKESMKQTHSSKGLTFDMLLDCAKQKLNYEIHHLKSRVLEILKFGLKSGIFRRRGQRYELIKNSKTIRLCGNCGGKFRDIEENRLSANKRRKRLLGRSMILNRSIYTSNVSPEDVRREIEISRTIAPIEKTL